MQIKTTTGQSSWHGGYIVTLLATSDLPDQQSLKAHRLAWRLFSASEVLLGAVIVIGHNVFHVVPNEVPIRAKSLGPGVGARIYRYRRGDRRIFRMGGVTARQARGCD